MCFYETARVLEHGKIYLRGTRLLPSKKHVLHWSSFMAESMLWLVGWGALLHVPGIEKGTCVGPTCCQTWENTRCPPSLVWEICWKSHCLSSGKSQLEWLWPGDSSHANSSSHERVLVWQNCPLESSVSHTQQSLLPQCPGSSLYLVECYQTYTSQGFPFQKPSQ